MDQTTVYIPNVTEETQIGNSFSQLFKVIVESEAAKGTVVWDFNEVKYLHPFFLAPLAIYKNTSDKDIQCTNIPLHIQSYLNSIYFNRMLHFENDSKADVESIMYHFTDKNFIPLCSFAMTDANKDVFGTVVQRIITTQTNLGTGGITPLCYFISELLDNIFEHSKSKNGYIFSQYQPHEQVINLCIADAGITIYNSYRDAHLFQKEIDGDEANALWLANEGYSTKNRPGAENRGYGISTSKRMLVEGLGGSFFMLSGGAFHRYEKGKQNYYANLQELLRWKGTVILMRIPINQPKGFNYTDYLE